MFSARRSFVAGHRLAAGLCLALAGAIPASAGPVADAAGEAERSLAAGASDAAIAAFDRAADAFWQALPLGFRTAVFARRANGFGDYEARADGPFRPGETVLIYLEPVGYGWTATGDGFRIRLSADLEIRTAAGIILAKAEDFAAVEQVSRAKSREFQATIGLTLPNLKPDSYELRLTVRDATTGKFANLTMPFVVAP